MIKNKENARRLIERLEQCTHVRTTKKQNAKKMTFCMSWYFFDCGSPACIAGHAFALMGKYQHSIGKKQSLPWSIHHALKEFLDCSGGEASSLCSGSFSAKELEDITPKDAIGAIQRMMQ